MENPSFVQSAEARLLFQYLRTVQKGEIATYEKMSEECGTKVFGGFPPLQTALKRLLRDHDTVFSVVRGVGFKHINSSEIVDEGASFLERQRKMANRSVERATKADFAELDLGRQAKLSAHISIMSTISMMTKESSVAKIEAKTAGKTELPVAETLRMFLAPSN